MQQRVLQHRAVAVREHEAVAIRPVRIGRIVAQMPRPQRDGDFGHAHRHAGMAALRGFDGVHRQRADRVGEFGVGTASVMAERGWRSWGRAAAGRSRRCARIAAAPGGARRVTAREELEIIAPTAHICAIIARLRRARAVDARRCARCTVVRRVGSERGFRFGAGASSATSAAAIQWSARLREPAGSLPEGDDEWTESICWASGTAARPTRRNSRGRRAARACLEAVRDAGLTDRRRSLPPVRAAGRHRHGAARRIASRDPHVARDGLRDASTSTSATSRPTTRDKAEHAVSRARGARCKPRAHEVPGDPIAAARMPEAADEARTMRRARARRSRARRDDRVAHRRLGLLHPLGARSSSSSARRSRRSKCTTPCRSASCSGSTATS